MSNELNETVVIDDAEFSLADLAGVDMSSVEAVRFQIIPIGKYHWRIIESTLGMVEKKADYDDPSSEMVKRPEVKFVLESQNCLALVDDKLDPADFVGRKHTISFVIKELKKDLGKVQAFLTDIGMPGDKPLGDMIPQAHGHEFVCDIAHAKNPNNADYPFVNLKNHQTIEEYNASVAG